MRRFFYCRRHFLALGLASTSLMLGKGVIASVTRRLQGRYEVQTSGLNVAEIELERRSEGAMVTEMRLKIGNRGVARLLGGRHRIEMVTRYQAGRAVEHVSSNEKPDRHRLVKIAYGPSGLVDDVVIENDGRPRASEVPRDLWQGTVDPLTALERLPEFAQTASPGAELVLPLFDGRKRADLSVVRSPVKDALKLRFDAVFGFDENDGYVSFEGQPPQILTLVFDQAEPHLPARLSAGGTLPTELLLTERRSR